MLGCRVLRRVAFASFLGHFQSCGLLDTGAYINAVSCTWKLVHALVGSRRAVVVAAVAAVAKASRVS